MTWFRVGGAGIPATLKNAMNSVLNKKFGTSGQNYPPKQWPDDVNLLGPLPEKTASGAIATFSDGADTVPLKKCEITLPASLDGYSSVDVKHCGKNLLPMVNYDGGVYNPDIGRQLNLTVSETQFTKNGNVYSVTTSVSWKTFTVLLPLISGVTYYEKWTLSIESGQQGSTRAYLDEDFKVLARYNSNSSDPITTNGVMSPPTGTKYLAITLTNRGTAVQTLKITEPMIEIGSSASAWEEYNGATHTASLGRTIYGGEVDVVSGEGVDGYGKVDLGTLTWTKRNTTSGHWRFTTQDVPVIINDDSSHVPDMDCVGYTSISPIQSLTGITGVTCNTGISQLMICDETYETASDFTSAVSGVYLVYPLATPESFTFDPVPIDSKLGNNTIWSEQGDAEVTYRADIDLALQAVSNNRGLIMASRPVTQLVGEESDPDQVNEVVENDETEQEGENDER